MMEAHLAAALNAKTMFSVKHLLDLHHHHQQESGVGGGSGGGKGDAMRIQLTAAVTAANSGGSGQTGSTTDLCSPSLINGSGSLHDEASAVVALMPDLQQLTGGGSGGHGGPSPVGFGLDVPDLAQAAVAMASCYDQDLNPYTRWLQTNTSLDYYTGTLVLSMILTTFAV